MNDYTGKVCPFCKTPIHPDDDVVICSACDMPHHKDCWVENQGCTTFGCPGTIKTDDAAATTVTATQMNYDDFHSDEMPDVLFCTKCGLQNSRAAIFCPRCGNKLVTEFAGAPQAPACTPSGAARADSGTSAPQPTAHTWEPPHFDDGIDPVVRQLIGHNVDYYTLKFHEIKSKNSPVAWNWAAFWVSPFWMIYRKMYAYAAALFGTAFLLTLFDSDFLSSLTIGGYVALGLFSNAIYMKFLEKKAARAKSMEEPYQSQYIAQNSGTNTIATVLTAVGYGLLSILLSL